MTVLRLIARGLAYHRRMHVGLLLGTCLACGILTGAFVVGDSVARTLHDTALMRLGGFTHALDWGNRFFAQDLAGSLDRADPRIRAAAVVALRGSASLPAGSRDERAPLNRVHVLGVDAAFWQVGNGGAAPLPGPQEAALNEAAAAALGVRAGDDIVVRLAMPASMPLNAPLAAHREDDTASRLVSVKTVLSDAHLGRFGLAANQAAPYNVFMDRAWLQEQASVAGQANLLAVATEMETAQLQRALRGAWNLETIGYRLRAHASGVLQLESPRIFLEDEAVRAALEIPGAFPVLTYLVNDISRDGRSTPYSFVVAGPVPPDMPDDAVLINQWLADAIGAGPGDRIEVAYSELLSSDSFSEKRRSFSVFRVLPVDALEAERGLAPQFPGLSGVETCRDWDIGMPLDEAKLKDPANEAYWRAYGQTPKLLTTFKAGKEMWGTRFGSVMAVRFPAGTGEQAVRETLRTRMDAEKIGLAFAPVREQALRAVENAMDFGGLFAGMSLFLIVAALVLAGLLYAYGLQQRAAEIGTLLALGYTEKQVRRIALLEACPAAIAGAALGAGAGVGYAWLLLAGVKAFWPAAVAGAAIAFHASASAPIKGAAAGLVCVFAVVFGSVWRSARRPARELLARDVSLTAPASRRRVRLASMLAATILLVSAAAIGVSAPFVSPDNLTEPFFAIGFLLLIALLTYYMACLMYLAERGAWLKPRLWKLSLTNLTRRTGRSLAVAVVTACGAFLVLSVSGMHENLALHAGARNSGTGGFGVYAETAVAVSGSAAVTLGIPAETLTPLRLRDGDDASCLNLNRAQQPRLIGVDPARFAQLGAFAEKEAARELWDLLEAPLPDGQVPALAGDTNTAMWGLQAKTGLTDGTEFSYRDQNGAPIIVKLVGAIPARLSVFQGALLISERSFTRLYPSEGGYRAFLVDTPRGSADEAAARLNREGVRLGIDAATTLNRLRAFYSVETAYLAMFLVLGGLGLVLGAAGVGIVVMRNLFERRFELALLQAVGFERAKIRRLLDIEHVILAAAGALIGAIAALASVFPLRAASQTDTSAALQFEVLGVIALAYAAAVFVALRVGLRGVTVDALREE